MNLFELKKKAAELAQAGATKSRQLAAIAKLKAANLGEEDAIRKAYIELGKQYFAMYGEHPEDEFAAACSIVKESQATIAANNALIEEIKAAEEEAADVVIDEDVAADVDEPVAPVQGDPVMPDPEEEVAPAEEKAAEEETPVEEEAAAEEEAPAEEGKE